MASSVPIKKMKRSKSLNSLMESGYRCESECEKNYAGDDSGVQADADGFSSLERKVDKLSDICCEQTRVVAELAAQVRGRGAGAGELARAGELLLLHNIVDRMKSGESRARSLLDAIEARPSLERRVGAALADLLQSEDLKQRIVSATAASVKEQLKSLFSSEVSALYVPAMERAHRQLLKHVNKVVAAAFADLEENAACSTEALRHTSQSLQAALQRHETLLQRACTGGGLGGGLVDAVIRTTEKVVERELKQWREEMSNAMLPAAAAATVSECECECVSARAASPAPPPPPPPCARAGPEPEPAPEARGGTELSPVDRMMITAEVRKLIREGDVNGAFTRALLAADLRVLAAACRAAPVPPPAPHPALPQPVLLSLLQQLATDLLLDTPLKCSYIEYALESLDPSDAATRAHLPVVLGELHRHLAAFLQKYPHHIQAPRISAIIDTARSLL